MTYTEFAVTAVVVVAVLDATLLRTRVLFSRNFWLAYAIILPAQLISNGVLTGTGTVRYDGRFIIGASSPSHGAPAMFGGGRFFFAPVEDLLFGFALISLTLALWRFWGSRGVGESPKPGPPRWVRR